MKRNTQILSFFAIILLLSGCANLDINDDPADTYLEPEEYEAIIEEQFRTLFLTDTYYHALALSTMGDGLTTAWGGFDWGWIGLSAEPRVKIPNTPTSQYGMVVEDPWNSYFGIITSANEVIKAYTVNEDYIAVDNLGNDITYQVIAKAQFLRGAAYGSLSKLYDKAKVVDETTTTNDLDELAYSTYQELATEAVQMIEESIKTANSGADFTIDSWNGVTLNREEFVQVCRTMQAKILVQNARNEEENSSVDWSKVYDYAIKGVDFTLAPEGNSTEGWYDQFIYYANQDFWARLDMRLIAMLDPTQPTRFPTDGTTSIGPATFVDKRGEKYLVYDEDIPYRAERGYYRYSHYYMSRYDYHVAEFGGPMPYVSQVDNDLLVAESLIRSGGDRSTAALYINKTRINNGELSPLIGTENTNYLLQTVFHERFIELLSTSPGSIYFDRRRLPEDNGDYYGPYTGLLPCTPRNMPIPATELQILNLEYYTFGGCE